MTESNKIQRILPVSRARRELTSIVGPAVKHFTLRNEGKHIST